MKTTYRAWGRQAELKREAIPNQKELLYRIQKAKCNLRDKALIAMAYLTSGRISEIVSEKYLRKTFFVKQNVNGVIHILRQGKKPIVDRIERIRIDYPGIVPKDIYDSTINGRKVMVIDMQNRKNKHRFRKQVPILTDAEKGFIYIIEEYIKTLRLDEPLFPFGKIRAYQIIRKNMNMNCHFLRDIRLTHLVQVYHMDGSRLMKYAGWTDLRPAQHYVQLDWQDIWK